MSLLDSFESLSFIDQVNLLETISARQQVEAVDDLFSLCHKQHGNDSLVYMIKNTLRNILLASEELTVKGLSSTDPLTQEFCIGIAGQKGFGTAILADLARKETDRARLFAMLAALSRTRPAAAADIFREHLDHPDAIIATIAVEMAGAYGDELALPALIKHVNAAESDHTYTECSLLTAGAINSIGAIRNAAAIDFLAAKLHHRNPTARRLIHAALTSIGQPAVNAVAARLDAGSVDETIMAANVLGLLGGESAARHLMKRLNAENTPGPNLRFALYEAIGRCASPTAEDCLLAGLNDDDERVLLAVVTAIDRNLTPKAVEAFKLRATQPGGERAYRALVLAQAMALFESLYHADKRSIRVIIDQLTSIGDVHLIEVFRERLILIGEEKAVQAAGLLKRNAPTRSEASILVVDDSHAMLSFYRSALSEMNAVVLTAGNGKEALELIEQGCDFDLIISDMNMPVMDGIEFTRKLRDRADLTPIVMVTTESERSQADLARSSGVNAFLTKPFDAGDLRNMLTKQLHR